MEIYNETMMDLLSTLSSSIKDSQSNSYPSNSLQVIEDDHGSIYIRGLSKHLAQNEEDALNMLFEVTNDLLFGDSNISLHPPTKWMYKILT